MSAPAVPLTAAAEIGPTSLRSRKRSPSSRTFQSWTLPRPNYPKPSAACRSSQSRGSQGRGAQGGCGPAGSAVSRQGHVISPGDRAGAKADADEQRPASAASPRWRPWWRWRRWRVRCVARWRPQALPRASGHMMGREAAASNNSALEASVARIDADICRPEDQRRTHLQDGHEPVQQDQRPARQGRRGRPNSIPGRACQAQRGRRQAPTPSRGCRRPGRREGRHGIDHTFGDRSGQISRPPHRQGPMSSGCRRWKAGYCAMLPTAAR